MKSSALIQNAIDFMDYQFDYVPCDLINIKRLLPILYDEQCEDVLAIEKRFQVGKGYLITNGTGTGKTLVGLGVIKRFLVQNKRNILIVVPTDPKCEDWIQEGFEKTDITITKLTSITDKGIGVRVTTYANFYQNQAIEEELFDLVIYDESHYLTQNQAGKETSCLAKHHVIVNTPRQARAKAVDYAGPVPKLPDTLYDIRQKEIFDAQKKEWARRHDEHATKLINTTKVLFLSATPFAYHKSLIYVDGTLYPIYEKEIEERDQGSYYNETTGFEKFLVENFGYRMRNNKVTKPEADVNQSLLEREFFEKMVKDGVASTRVIDIDVDYSRDFYKVDSTIGETIDNGRALLYEQDFEIKIKNWRL